MRYTLYHATDAAAVPLIMAGGFVGDEIWFGNTPWKIGVKGEELIELTMEFDEDELSFLPDSPGFHHVVLSGDYVNEHALTKRVVGDDEKRRLIAKLGPPGDWPSRR